jgi:hypothetical protein
VRDAFLSEYNVREFKLIPKKEGISDSPNTATPVFETVDQTVLAELGSLEDGKFKKDILMNIYNGLDNAGI